MGRGDEQSEASANRKQSGESSEQCAVVPAHPRARRASLEHGALMAQDQDLEVLGGCTLRSGLAAPGLMVDEETVGIHATRPPSRVAT